MISKYLSSKKTIEQIKPLVDYDELVREDDSPYIYLNHFDYRNDISTYNNLFTDFELNSIISIGDKLIPKDAYVSGNNIREVDKNARISKVSWIPNNNVTAWIYKKIIDCVYEMNESFYKYDLEKLERLQFTKYFGNQKGFYTKHIDTMHGVYPHNRKLTFILQLSDPSEYTGGELQLHVANNPTVVEKKKGMMVFFPSYTLHECTPVTSGERYTLVGWVHGPRFK
jgi:PKHD-type hydroxylase